LKPTQRLLFMSPNLFELDAWKLRLIPNLSFISMLVGTYLFILVFTRLTSASKGNRLRANAQHNNRLINSITNPLKIHDSYPLNTLDSKTIEIPELPRVTKFLKFKILLRHITNFP
jgi:hypothetical protein